MKLISNFKKAGCVLAICAMTATALVLPGKVSADCEGPTNLEELQTLLDARTSNLTVALCGDIEGTFTAYRATTIDLNDHAISGEPFARVAERGTIKIVGPGTVDGRISNGLTTRSFSVEGGMWTNNPANFVRNPYAVYNVDGKYLVEPNITANNFVVTPEESSEGLFFEKGKTLTGAITVTLPEGSTSGVTYASEDESIVTVDDEGTLTGVEAGYTTIIVRPTLKPTIQKEVTVTVYAVEPTTKGDEGEIGAAANLTGLIESAIDEMGEESQELTDKLTTAFGEDEADSTISNVWDAVYYGDTINTKVNVVQASLTDDERAEMVALMDGVSMDNVAFYDVTVDLNVYGDRIGGLKEMDTPIRIYLAEATDPEAGYTRQYFMVSYHNNEPEPLEEGVDFEIVDGKIYLISNKFSVFALGYSDTLIPVTYTTTVGAPVTGAYTSEGSSSASASSSVAVAVVAGATAVVLGGAVVFAKRK